MFAGNLTGRTQTLPLAIYTAMESDLRAAQSLSIVLVSVAFGLLWAVRGGASQLLARDAAAMRGGTLVLPWREPEMFQFQVEASVGDLEIAVELSVSEGR